MNLIDRYEILTPSGFKDFKAIKRTTSSLLVSIKTSKGREIKGSPDHKVKLFKKKTFTLFCDLISGDKLSKDEIIESIDYISGQFPLFTIQGVEGEEYLIEKDIVTKNCAFIPEGIFEEFWSSVIPTISSGTETKIIVVSCVTKDTFIFDSNKGITTIGNYINEKESDKRPYIIEDYSILGFNKSPSKGNVFFNNGFQETLKIKSRYFELECSRNHPLYVCSSGGLFGWKEAKDLSLGDYICSKYNNNIFGTNDDTSSFVYERRKRKGLEFSTKELTPDICYFLGLYIAEGCFCENSVTLTCGDSLFEILEKLNLLPVYCPDNLHYTISSTELVDYLKFLGFKQTKAQFKEIPERLMSMSKENCSALLSGLFDGDGCATKRSQITYTSTSEKLINQIRILLNNFGILSTKRSNQPLPRKFPNGKTYETVICYILEIYQFSYKFFTDIGFRFERKQNRIGKHFSEFKHFGNNYDIVPFSFETFRPYIKRYKIKNLLEEKTKLHYSRVKALIFKEKYYNVIPELKEFFDKHVQEDLYWDKIEKIDESSAETFDFSLPDNEDDFWCHSVLYNNIVGHQTSNGLNHYYTLWNDALEGKNGFAPFRVDWWDVPGRDEAWAAQMRVSVKKFEQEFGNEFFGRATSVIPTPLLKSLTFKQPISSNPEMKIFELPQKGRAYLGVVDVSEGVGGDYSVLTIFKMPQSEEEPFEIVFTFRSNMIDVFRFTEIVHTFSQKFNESYLIIEVNVMNIAESLYRDYEVENIIKTTISKQKMTTTFFSGGSKLGVKTTEVIKKIGLEKLIQIFEDKKLIVNDFSYIEELSTLQKDKKTFKAKSGSNDDTSMTLILFAWLTTQEGFKELFGMEDFKRKLNNEYLESVYNSLPEFFIEDGINQNF